MLTGGTPPNIQRDAMARLRASAENGGVSSTDHRNLKEIKLCYVTVSTVDTIRN